MMRLFDQLQEVRRHVQNRNRSEGIAAIACLEKNAKQLEEAYNQASADNLDLEYDLMKATGLLEQVSDANPTEILSREIRDAVHVLLGRLKEARMHRVCPCAACKGRTRHQVYLAATETA